MGIKCEYSNLSAAWCSECFWHRHYVATHRWTTLAQAARAVLQNTTQINQMLSDLNRVDFANVQVWYSSFAALVCTELFFIKQLNLNIHFLVYGRMQWIG